jgi:hypothetical protein
MALNPTDQHHCVIIPRTGDADDLMIPLSLHGVTSYFNTRKPTRQEFKQSDSDLRIEMTYESPDWDPSDDRFAKAEQAMADDNGLLYERTMKPNRVVLSALTSSHETRPETFSTAMQNNVRIKFKSVNIKSITSRKGMPAIGPKTLAKRWKIGLDTAVERWKQGRSSPSAQLCTQHYRGGSARTTANSATDASHTKCIPTRSWRAPRRGSARTSTPRSSAHDSAGHAYIQCERRVKPTKGCHSCFSTTASLPRSSWTEQKSKRWVSSARKHARPDAKSSKQNRTHRGKTLPSPPSEK